MRRVLILVLGGWLIAGTTVTGCGRPKLNDADLGELQTDASQLPGAGEEYELPEPIHNEDETRFDAEHP